MSPQTGRFELVVLPSIFSSEISTSGEVDERHPLKFRATLRIGCVPNREPGLLGVAARLNLEIKQPKRPTKKDPSPTRDIAEVDTMYATLVEFQNPAEIPLGAEELSAFAVGPMADALFPYIQEAIADVTRRMGYPPLSPDRAGLTIEPFVADDSDVDS